MTYILQNSKISRQRGAVLIVSLVFMLILTIIAAASMQSSTLQERMAGNAKDSGLAWGRNGIVAD
jgi:type IV pilus assembly protein PilX